MGVELLNSNDISTREIATKGSKIKLSFALDFSVEETCFFEIKFPREVMIDIDDVVISYNGGIGYGYNPSFVSKS